MSLSPFITFGEPAMAPTPWARFALDHPDMARPGDGKPVEYSLQRFADIARINSAVNQGIDYIPPSRAAIEEWRILSLVGAERPRGTCHDFAVTKRFLLSETGEDGVPLSALCLAIVVAKEAPEQLHCVLIVRTTQGDLVCDSLVSGPPLVWHVRNFIWVSIQSPQDPDRWVKVIT